MFVEAKLKSRYVHAFEWCIIVKKRMHWMKAVSFTLN